MTATDRLTRLDDYRWLVGPEARPWLELAAAEPGPLVQLAARLRRELSPERTHLVLETVELRRRGRAKFALADRMFFTPTRLEQATDQWVAAYKAGRFPRDEPTADLCCGIGGDLVALAGRGPATGVDRDPVAALLAETNALAAAHTPSPAPLAAAEQAAEADRLAAAGTAVPPPDGADVPSAAKRGDGPSAANRSPADVRVADAEAFAVADVAAWHLDPDRRTEGRRTTRVDFYEPPLEVIRRLLALGPHAAVKLAPAADPPEDWRREAELEWIGRDRQCRQLVAWFGNLAREPGCRRATILESADEGRRTGGSVTRSVTATLPPAPPAAEKLGRYVFDPHAAVLAAGLAGVVAKEHGLGQLDPGAAYLTGDVPLDDAAVACFEVTDVLPMDLKRLRRLLSARKVGRLEIKKRGVPHEPEAVRRRLQLRGDGEAVLLIAPLAGSVTAILARRFSPPRRETPR